MSAAPLQHVQPARGLLAALCVLLGVVCPAAAAGWWDHDWTYRRRLTVPDYEATDLDGDDVAAVTMPTGGLSLADAGDIRLVSAKGKLMAHRVLMTGPGDQVRVAFALRPQETSYYVYFGNPKPPKPPAELEIRRGVLQETWDFPGGPHAKFAEVRAVFGRVRKLQGRGFRTRIFQGHNPFGPSQGLASIFTAYFVAPENGQYVFCTSSRNSSYLLVDEKLVVSNGGDHPPQRDVSHQGQLRLRAGLHKLTFYHVSSAGDPVVVAAWRPPGARKISLMPPGAFTQVFTAHPGGIEQYGKSVSIDFLPDHAGESFMNNRYFQRFRFEAQAAGYPGRQVTWQWRFGDGQTATGRVVEHVYLLAGEVTVTLTARTVAGQLTRTNRIVVSRPWDRVIQNRLDSLEDHARIVGRYNFATLSVDAAAEAMDLLRRAEATDAIVRAGSAFLERDPASGRAVVRVLDVYCGALLERNKSAEASEALVKAVKLTKTPAAQAAMLTKAGRICLVQLDRDEQALKFFDEALALCKDKRQRALAREAHIGVGDVWRRRGDYDKAAKAYEEAGPQRPQLTGQKAFAAGDLARHVEAYLRRRQYAAARQYLDDWARTLPADKLDGYWSLLLARWHVRKGNFADAAKEAEILVAVNPSSSHAAELLMLAADAYDRLDEDEKMVRALRAVTDNYPESPLAPQAAEKLRNR